ncbi:MAG: hypothetical protein Tsb0021_04310 [Chlamydiales bacterium]
MVIAGTFLEAQTESHAYASFYLYQHPIFVLLLWMLFINILFASLRRWPFKIRHVPFLITHLGLLMILGGALTKAYFGIQGFLPLVEGSANQNIHTSHSQSLYCLMRNGTENCYSLNDLKKGIYLNDVHLKLAGYLPNVKQIRATWLKNETFTFKDMHPIPILRWQGGATYPFRDKWRNWSVGAYQIENLEKFVKETLTETAIFHVVDRRTGEKVLSYPLGKVIQEGCLLGNRRVAVDCRQNIDVDEGALEAVLNIHVDPDDIHFEYPLIGDRSLICLNQDTEFLGQFPLEWRIERVPFISFIKQADGETFLLAHGPLGEIYFNSCEAEGFSSVYCYDHGFMGYSVQTEIPFDDEIHFPCQDFKAFEQIITEASSRNDLLAPPFEILRRAALASGKNFAEINSAFFSLWYNNYGWLIPDGVPLTRDLEQVLSDINWNVEGLFIEDHLENICTLFDQLDVLLEQGETLKNLISFVDGNFSPFELLDALTKKVFEGPVLTEAHQTIAHSNVRKLSAFFRLYGISPHEFVTIKREPSKTLLETPLAYVFKALAPSKQLEKNTPLATIQVQKEGKTYYVSLPYDHTGTGMRWPLISGLISARFQPERLTLPYSIRLRQAREKHYPNSGQVQSYEADIYIKDTRTGASSEATLSMNHVYESSDGYRFYLSHLQPSNGTNSAKSVIIVNRDPGKYILTYPGGIITAVGMILLAFQLTRRKRSPKS